MSPEQRNAVIGAAVAVTVYAAICLWLGWDHPAYTLALVFFYVFAGVLSLLYLASQWLGHSAKTPTGFRVGGATYLAPRKATERQRAPSKAPNGLAAKVAQFCDWIPWQLKEPFFRLPVLLPAVWGAATFASVEHRVPGDIYGQLAPTLIALIAAVIAINGFLAVRGQRTIDFLGALATVLVLIAGTTISLVQIASESKDQVQWVAAALVFSLVAILQTGICGANSPDNGEPGSSQPPHMHHRASAEVLDKDKSEIEQSPSRPCTKPPHCSPPLQPREINLLAAAGALAVLVLLVSVLWLAPLVIRGAALGAGGLHLASVLFLFGSAACLVAWARLPPEQREPWLRRAIIGAAIATLFGIGGSFVQKHVERAAEADCLAFDTQFAQLAGYQTPTIALRLSKRDQRRRVCMSALKGLNWSTTKPDCLAFDGEFAQLVRDESLAFALRAMQSDGRRTACEPTLGRIEKTPQITDCVAFLAEIDQLVDDEPIRVAATAIEHYPRTSICHPRLGLLARR